MTFKSTLSTFSTFKKSGAKAKAKIYNKIKYIFKNISKYILCQKLLLLQELQDKMVHI